MKKDWFTGSLPEVDETGQPTGLMEDFIFHANDVTGTTVSDDDGQCFANLHDFRQVRITKSTFKSLCSRGKEPYSAQ